MAISFDSQATSTVGTASSITYSHTNAGNILLVGVVLVDSNSRTISSVTYGGDALTALYTGYSPGTNRLLAMYFRQNPKTGANNVVVTLSGAVSNNIVSSSLSYNRILSTFPDANTKVDQTSGTSITAGVTTVADNAWLAGFVWGDFNLTAGTDTTKRVTSTYGNSYLDGFDSGGAKTPAGAYSLNVNIAGDAYASFMLCSIAPQDLLTTVSDSLVGITDTIVTQYNLPVTVTDTLTITDEQESGYGWSTQAKPTTTWTNTQK